MSELTRELTWDVVRERAVSALAERGLDGIYRKRLDFEISEVDKQGASSYWTGLVRDNCRFDKNPNKLVLPWLLGMVDDDPVAGRAEPVMTSARYADVIKHLAEHGKLPPEITRDADNPDIDIDCLPEARDPIKAYATEKYSQGINDGYGAVCSVGTWMTYLLRSALKDVAKAKATCDPKQVDAMTKELPDEVDDLKDNGESPCKGCKTVHNEAKCPQCGSPDTENPTIGRLLEEQPLLRKLNDEHPEVVDLSVRLVGRVRAMGKHAGALIIADRPLFGNIPMSLDTNTKQWKSLWTEGRSTQLSKFGYTKWDILGLKNLRYIYEASRMIEQNHGISFGERTTKDYQFTPGYKVTVPSMSGWDDIDPEEGVRRAGHYFTRYGEQVSIAMDDHKVLHLASESLTDAVFQFDTDLAKRILSNGVYSFNDLMTLNAMGHPGPMAMIPDWVKRRNGALGLEDGDTTWRELEDPRITEILGETFNTIVYQEQLQTMWQRLAGFTAPEAQEARKAVAKKWKDKLKPIKERWLRGAGPIIGEAAAHAWWDKMETFGRYAFNRSHSVAYCLVAFRCLWLKAYFPQEWWASVQSYCNADKLVRYMTVARGEGVKFVPMDVNHLTLNFQAVPDQPRVRHDEAPNGHVSPGLICLKGIGEKVAAAFTGEALPASCEEAEGALADAEAMLESVDEYCHSDPMPQEDIREMVGAAEADVAAAEEALADAAIAAAKQGPIESVDDFVQRKGKNKLIMERLIKLGSFKPIPGHECSKAVWTYYQCMYCSGPEITALKTRLKQAILDAEGWNDEAVAAERQRQEAAFRQLHPRRQIPKKITNWKPKPVITLDAIIRLEPDDFTLTELLKFEEQYLGYHLHSPLDAFMTRGGRTIPEAKENGEVEAVISEVYLTKTKNNSPMCKLTITDGTHTAPMIIWSDELDNIDRAVLRTGCGMRARVAWDLKRKNFTLRSGAQIIRLKRKDDAPPVEACK